MTLLMENWLTINLIIINFCAKISNCELNLLIIHTGCIHSRFDETLDSTSGKYCGGVDKLAYMVKKARKEYESGEGPAVLYLDTGDIFSGSIWFFVHSYKGAAQIMNKLQPDAFNIGAREFDLNIDGLINFTNLVTFPLISTNALFDNEPELTDKIKLSLIKEIDGFKVGIVGCLLPENIIWKEKGSVQVLDIVVELNKECNRLKFEENVDVIIVLSHGSFDSDRLIAQSVDHINVIVGSGSTTFLYSGDPPDTEIPADTYPAKILKRNGNLVLIVHAYEYLKYVGQIQIKFTKHGEITGFFGSPILLDTSIPRDPDMSELLAELREEILFFDQKVLSTCSVFLEGLNCRYQECNFGNMVMDAIVEYRANQYQGRGWTDAAIALMNSGSLITDINSPQNGNKIFYGDIMRALPFSEMLYIVEIRGYDLLFILEICTAGLDPSSKVEFLLISGLKVMFDFENRFGQRVKLVKVRCAECEIPEYFPLDVEKRYKVLITSYLLKGGSGFAILRDVVWNPISIDARDTEVTIQYLEKSSYINPEIGGRFIPYDKRLDESKSNSFSFRYCYDCCCLYLILITFIVLFN